MYWPKSSIREPMGAFVKTDTLCAGSHPFAGKPVYWGQSWVGCPLLIWHAIGFLDWQGCSLYLDMQFPQFSSLLLSAPNQRPTMERPCPGGTQLIDRVMRSYSSGFSFFQCCEGS